MWILAVVLDWAIIYYMWILTDDRTGVSFLICGFWLMTGLGYQFWLMIWSDYHLLYVDNG